MAIDYSKFQPAQGRTLSSQIVDLIRDALFSGALKSGDTVGSEAELAQKLGVSRMSVRDALRSLEALGIVEIRMGAKGGAIVAQGSTKRFSDALAIQLTLLGVRKEDALQAQVAIESMSVQLAAMNATPQDLNRMRDLLDQARRKTDDSYESSNLGEAFHLAVVRA